MPIYDPERDIPDLTGKTIFITGGKSSKPHHSHIQSQINLIPRNRRPRRSISPPPSKTQPRTHLHKRPQRCRRQSYHPTNPRNKLYHLSNIHTMRPGLPHLRLTSRNNLHSSTSSPKTRYPNLQRRNNGPYPSPNNRRL